MTTTNNYTFAAGQIQNLEVNPQGIVTPRLHDLDPLENTLLGALYPDIKIAVVNVPVEPLDDYQEAMVENTLAMIQWEGVRYKLMGASGSAKKGKFYFVDEQHIRRIAERFQHWPQAAIVYGGILVSPCKVMIEVPEANVLTVPDHVLGTNDSRGWIRRSLFSHLQKKHQQQLIGEEIRRLLRERYGQVPEWELVDEHEKQELTEVAKRKSRHKVLQVDRFYQFRMAFSTTQAKGAFKIMEDDVADALDADIVLPESAVKPGLKLPAKVEWFGPGKRFHGHVVVGIREVSRQLEFESSYTLVEHAPDDSIQLEILPQAIQQVSKLTEAVGEGRYEELLEILGRHPDKSLPDGFEQDSEEEFRVVEGLLLADASGQIVRHPYVNNQLNKLLARWAFKVTTAGGFRLPAFALIDDGYLCLKDGKVFCGSDWIPEHKAIAQLAARRGLCVRYPIRMFDDLLPCVHLQEEEVKALLTKHLGRQKCEVTPSLLELLITRQLRLEGTYILHSETAKKNGGDYDFDWVCIVEEDRFPRFVKNRFRQGAGQQQGKNKANKARDPWFNLEHVAMKARGNHIGSITDLMTSCRAAGRDDLAAQLAKELQNALDSLKWEVQPDLKLVAEIRQQVNQAPWLRYKNERRVSDLPLHLDVDENTDRVGKLYNHVRKHIEDLLTSKAAIEGFKNLVVGEKVTREMLENCRFVTRAYKAMASNIAERREQLKVQLEKSRTEWEQVRQSPDKELRREKLLAKDQAYAAYRNDEERARYEMKAILAYIRIWAQDKTENRMGWLQALNRIVCSGRGNGSILVLAFPQELIDKLAERTGGKRVRVYVPRLHEGFIRTDSSDRTFLVEPIKGGGQKHTFLWKYKDGKLLLDDKPEPEPASTSGIDDDVSFPIPDDTETENADVPWVM